MASPENPSLLNENSNSAHVGKNHVSGYQETNACPEKLKMEIFYMMEENNDKKKNKSFKKEF